jgi:hemerythrin superfamily protein
MQHATRRSTSRASSPARRQRAAVGDAIALLKADHRQVETMFEQFEKSRSDQKKADLATNICESLRVHMAIEEEIFYPAFLAATGAEDLHHEAEIEHAGARNLMAQIEDSDPSDDYFDARVKVLSEMIKHHVKEEEQRDGMFAKAKSSDMDMAVVAEQMLARKSQLEAEGTDTLN